MSGNVPGATEAVEQPGGPVFQHVCQPFIPAAGHPNQRYPRPDPGGVLSGRVHSDWHGSAAECLRVMHMDGADTASVSLKGMGLEVAIELSPRNLRKAARLLLDCAFDMDGRADDVQPQPAQATA